MKKIFTLFAALAMVMSMSAKPYLRGSMNGWGSTEFLNGECTVNLSANTKYEFKVDENADWKTSYGNAAITSTNCTDVKLSGNNNATIQSTFKGDYKFKWNASNKTITVVYPTEEVVKPKKDITVKAKMPAEWTKTIDAWVWTDENPNGKAVTPERDGDWYVVTQNTAASYIIFRNGASWNGDSNQTADMRFEDNACIQLQYNANAKASYINIDCAGDTEDPTPDPEDPVDPNPGDDPVVEPETGVTYNVTVPAGTKACYIAGEMNGWSQQEMTKVDETHYTITIAEATTAMKYKYCSGPSWDYVEMQADGVTDVQDRTYAASDVVEAWKAVYEPAGEEPGDDPVDPNPGDDPVVEPETGVTYNVTVPAGTKACYIAGEMNGWSQQEMTKVDETHYTIPIAEATTAMKYKYCSGPDWAYVEMQADGVTDVQDRTYAANDVVEAWKAVYEPAGEEPGEDPGDDPVVEPETGVTYNVTVPAGTKACYIAGEMNTWSFTEMTKVDETHYTITIAEATTAMKYKYCSGPDWAYVEMQADGVTDVQDRTYSANDVVESWKAVYEPAGEEPGDDPVDPETAVDNVAVGEKAVKVIRNGQMYIIRNAVIYNAMGQIAE